MRPGTAELLTVVAHFQKEGLASFLIHAIGALHDFVDFERLLAERGQDTFSIIQHEAHQITENTKADLP
jgi:hypothetical protein